MKILDATAGNRSIWKEKDCPLITYIDIESELEIKPDLIMDCTNTNFEDQGFDMIFFDPPHYWGEELGNKRFAIRNNKEKKAYYDRLGSPLEKRPWGMIPYYGSDKYENKSQLIKFIYKAQLEFTRILDDYGVLWVKWNGSKLELRKVLPLFKEYWVEVMRLKIGHPKKSGKAQTHWIMFRKIIV